MWGMGPEARVSQVHIKVMGNHECLSRGAGKRAWPLERKKAGRKTRLYKLSYAGMSVEGCA